MRPSRHCSGLHLAIVLLCASPAHPAGRPQTTAPAQAATAPAVTDPESIDLTAAVVVTPGSLSVQERTAIRVFLEEMEKLPRRK